MTTLGGTVAGTGQNLSGTVSKTTAPVVTGVSFDDLQEPRQRRREHLQHGHHPLVNNTTAGVGTIVSNATGAVGKLLGAKH